MSEHALEGVTTARAGGRRGAWAGAAWRQYRLERRMFWRNPTAAFFGFLLPLVLLGLFGAVLAGDQDALDVVVPGIAGVSVVSATFISLTYYLVFLRERGILKRLHGTPLPPSAYFAGIAANAVANAALQVALVIVAGRVFFGIPWPGDWLALAVFLAVGVVSFAALGVALSAAIPNSESAPAYVNAVFLPMLFIAGVFFDEANAPALLRNVAEVLPLTHLVNGLAGAMIDGDGVADHATSLLVLAAWGALGIVLGLRGFSREARAS